MITRTGTLIEIAGRFRVEPGPPMVKAKATKELLGEATAEHYQEGAIDALGQPIELGKDMTYLDWVGHRDGDQPTTVFYLYRLEDTTKAERAEGAEDTVWREVDTFPTEDEALNAALAEQGS